MNSQPEPCPVCGAAGGNCVGDSPAPRQIIGANLFPSLGHEMIHIVKEDVYEERVITAAVMTDDEEPRQLIAPKVMRILVARAGDAIKESEALRLGILSS